MNPNRFGKKRHNAILRAKAEAQLAHAPAMEGVARPAEELLHELRVHQIELEMQNEELRRAQVALEESRDRYVDLYEFAPLGYLTLTRDGVIAEINLTGAALLGGERKKILRRRLDAFVASADRDRWHSLFVSVMRHDGRQRCDLALQRPDGSSFHARLDCLRVEADSAPPVVRLALSDITRNKEAEEALRAGKERYHSLFAGMTEGFALHEIICDEEGRPCDYRFLEINPSFERLTGLKREDVIGRTLNQVLPNEDPKWIRAYGEVALTGKPMRFVNFAPTLERHYEVYAYRPAPGQFAVLFTDVTERERAEQARRDADQRKDEFLAMLAHELRNPLAPIRNAAHILGRLGLEEPRIKWAQEIIERQVTLLSRMVDDLLDVSRIVLGKIALKQEPVEFAVLVEQMMESARPLAEGKGHQLTVRLPEQAVWLEGDPARLHQVLVQPDG